MTRLPDDLLTAYLDGEANERERAAVEARLTDEPAWRRELTDLAWARDALRHAPWPECPPAAWDHVLDAARVACEPTREGERPFPAPPPTERRVRGPHRRRRLAAWGALGAAAAAVVVAVALPRTRTVRPPVAALVSSHAARSSVIDDPVTVLAPLGLPPASRR